MADRLYTITGQRPTTALINRVLTDVYVIDYEGPNNITGAITVPVRTATPDQVDQLIRARLDTQLQISQLGTE